MNDVFSRFPVLRTRRLDLVEIEQKHLPDLFALFSHPEVTRYYNVVPLTKEAQAQTFINHFKNRYREKAAIRWGISLRGEAGIIGTLGFNNFTPNHRANTGYDLLPQHWNKGIVTEALAAIIDFGFAQLNINRIEAEVMPGNEGSEQVLQKLGFLKEGVLREWMLFNNRHYDMMMFPLLEKDWQNTGL